MRECSTLTEKIKDFYSTFFWFSIPRSPLPPCIIPGLSPHRLLPPPATCSSVFVPLFPDCTILRTHTPLRSRHFLFLLPLSLPHVALRCTYGSNLVSLFLSISVHFGIFSYQEFQFRAISLLVPLHVISLKESHYNRVRRVIVRQ